MSSDNLSQKTPLEDLMVAMDIVDTLRHRQGMVEKELNADQRRQTLIEKLRDIYEAQGIDVTEALLKEGVLAMEEERFSYSPPESSFSVWLAKLYVYRSRWFKPLLIVMALLVLFFIGRYALVTYPALQKQNDLPTEISQVVKEIKRIANDQGVVAQAEQWQQRAKSALNTGKLSEAETFLQDLNDVKSVLEQSYSIRIVSRPGELSGVWRIPDANPNARNYYLIVEAVDRNGKIVLVPILNEENNSEQKVKKWGIRVSQSIFQQVASDKQDDGIIQQNKVGSKVVGNLEPRYLINISGASITEW